jgi:hypothetical protein
MSLQAKTGRSAIVSCLGWLHLGSVVLGWALLPLAFAGIPVVDPIYGLFSANLLLFVAFTFWRLPTRPKLSTAVMPILLAVAFLVTSHTVVTAPPHPYVARVPVHGWMLRGQQLATSLSTEGFGSPGYFLLLMRSVGWTDIWLIGSFAIVYYCAANVPRPWVFGYLLLFPVCLAPTFEVTQWITSLSHQVTIGQHPLVLRSAAIASFHPNVLAAQTLLYGSLAGAMIASTRRPAVKVALVLMVVVNVLCLFSTLSRGTWFGALLMLAAAPLLSEPKSPVRKYAAAGLLLLLPLAGAVILHRGGLVGDLAARVVIWKQALRVFAAHPLFGAGFETYPVFTYGFTDTRYSHAHSIFLGALSELGLVGTALVAWACIVIIRKLSRLISTAPERALRAQGFGVMLGLTGLLAAGLWDYMLFLTPVVYFSILILAAIFGARQQCELAPSPAAPATSAS